MIFREEEKVEGGGDGDGWCVQKMEETDAKFLPKMHAKMQKGKST